LHGLPIVERFSLDGFFKLFSSQLHALSFLCRLNIMRQTWQKVRSMTVKYQKCHQKDDTASGYYNRDDDGVAIWVSPDV
jgi:hypothetical protein